jgi:uncharacterized membrane protein YdbT with pleckstrin-like domain
VETASEEQVFFKGHPSWRSMLAFQLKGLLAAIIAGVLAGLITAAVSGKVSVPWVIAAVLVVFVIVAVFGAFRRRRTTYTISSQRLTIETGLAAREVHETRLERVQNVNSRQSMLERLMRVGTVDFDTAGSASFDFSFRGVAHPRRIVRTVDRALRERAGPDALGERAGPDALGERAAPDPLGERAAPDTREEPR